MKKLVVGLLLIALLINIYCIYSFNFTNSIYIITENDQGKKEFYQLNDRRTMIKSESFIPDYMITYEVNSCIKNENNKNTVTTDTCRVFINGNDTNLTSSIKKIILEMAKKNNREIITFNILKINNEYFAIIELEENNYKLYKYNYDQERIKLLYKFTNEKIIGIRLNKDY